MLKHYIFLNGSIEDNRRDKNNSILTVSTYIFYVCSNTFVSDWILHMIKCYLLLTSTFQHFIPV